MHERRRLIVTRLMVLSVPPPQGERFVKRELLDGERFAEREAREVEFDVESGLRSFGKGFTILEGSLGQELTREEQVQDIARAPRSRRPRTAPCHGACLLRDLRHRCQRLPSTP